MPEKNVIVVTEQFKELSFKCRFCGQTKPYVELVVLDQYFPKISVCKECAKGTREES